MVKQWTAGDHKQVERVFIGALVGAITEPRVLQAARCLTDFVYVAQYHSHTDDTLMALQHALNDFHRLKDVFIELGCRDHFNIPKFHSLAHYIDTIRNLGSLDGVNTETSKQLHIDFAKKAYAATSRKDYTVQMTRWLQQQEVVIWFSRYLMWCRKTGRVDVDSSLSSDSEHDRQDLKRRPAIAPVSSQRYWISHQPQFPKRTIAYLEQHHGAVGFLDVLKVFLNTLPRRHQFFEPNANDRFNVFSNLVIFMNPMEHAASKNSRIRSHPHRTNGIRKPPALARYDTVLVEVDAELQKQGGLHGTLISLSLNYSVCTD